MPKSEFQKYLEYQRKRDKAMLEKMWGKGDTRAPSQPLDTGKPLSKTPQKPKRPNDDLLSVDGQALQDAIFAPIPDGAPVPDEDEVLTLEDENEAHNDSSKPLKPRTSEDNRLNEEDEDNE